MARPTQQEIEEWNARMNEPESDPDDDFEIEIFTPEGHGARLPYSRGKKYLSEHFGIEVEAPPAANGAPNGEPVPPEGEGDPNAQQRTSGRYFGGNRPKPQGR